MLVHITLSQKVNSSKLEEVKNFNLKSWNRKMQVMPHPKTPHTGYPVWGSVEGCAGLYHLLKYGLSTEAKSFIKK